MATARVLMPTQILALVHAAAREALVETAIRHVLDAEPSERFALMQSALPRMKTQQAWLTFEAPEELVQAFHAFAERANLRADVLLAGAILRELRIGGATAPAIGAGGAHGRPAAPAEEPPSSSRGNPFAESAHEDDAREISDDDPRTPEELERWALSEDTDRDEADAGLRRALRLREQSCGPEHDDAVAARYVLGSFYLVTKRPELALELFERNLRILESPGRPEFDRFDRMLSGLAMCYRMAGRLDDADACWRKIVGRAESAHEPSHEETAAAQFGYANFLANARRFDESLTRLAAALRVLDESGKGHTEAAIKMNYLASSVHGARDDLDAAERSHREYLGRCMQARSLPMGRPFRRPGR